MKIMVVDDEQGNLDELEQMLEKSALNIEPVFFSDPQAALKAGLEEDFDAALLDIQMPRLSGLELADRLLNVKAAMEIIFITAYDQYAIEAFEVNAVDYILKPVRFERLEKSLYRLERRKQHFLSLTALRPSAIHTLGQISLTCGNDEIHWNRGKTKELFCYLLMNKGKKTHKNLICEALWPGFESRRALANLQVTISRLRQNVAHFDRKNLRIDYSDNTYCLHLHDIYYDVDEFEQKLAEGREKSLAQAISIYAGGYLHEEGWLWAEVEKERLRQSYEKALENLARFYIEARNFEQAQTLLLNSINKEIPGDVISKLFLEASFFSGAQPRLEKAYGKLTDIYKKEMDMDVPGSIKRCYTRLSRE